MTRHSITFNLHSHGSASNYPLPILIVDSEHKELERFTLTSGSSVDKDIDIGDLELFAILRLPTGRAQVQPLEEDGVVKASVDFSVGNDSPHEWMAWSTLRTDLQRSVPPLMSAPGMDGAWVQIWELNTGLWRQTAIAAQHISHDIEGMQLELTSSDKPRALLVHLGTGSPQVISIPTRRPAVALITRAHTSGSSQTPRVVIGGYGGTTEAMLEFLRKGALGLADSAMDPGSELANQLLYRKVGDPLAATAAAYYLLRKRDWARLPQDWLSNLAQWFEYIPDATLLRDAALIERGMPSKAAQSLAARCLKAALAQGLPFFAEATTLISDLLFYAQKAGDEDRLTDTQLDLVRMLLAASQPAGLTFGFFGETPNRPIAAQDAQRATRAVALQRRLRSMRTEVVDGLLNLVVVDSPRIALASHALTVAVKGVTDVLARVASEQPVAPGNLTQTLVLRDVYKSGAAGTSAHLLPSFQSATNLNS